MWRSLGKWLLREVIREVVKEGGITLAKEITYKKC